METREVPADILIPGDEVRIDYEIVGNNEAQILAAVHVIKQTIAADERLNYQSGRIVDRTIIEPISLEEMPAQFLEIYVTIRATPKQVREQVDIQKAGFGTGVVVGLATAAVAALSAVVIYRDIQVNKTAVELIRQNDEILKSDNLTDEEKQAMIEQNRQLVAKMASSAGDWLSDAWSGFKDTAAAAAEQTQKTVAIGAVLAGVIVLGMYMAGKRT